MAHKHKIEENLFFNNSSTSSRSDSSSDEETGLGGITKNTYKKIPPSSFIYNDLKRMRIGGPLSSNGKDKGASPPSPPETKPCGAIHKGCRSNAETALYYPIKFENCRKKKSNHVHICVQCAFRRERCLLHGTQKIDNADIKHPESEKERWQAWP